MQNLTELRNRTSLLSKLCSTFTNLSTLNSANSIPLHTLVATNLHIAWVVSNGTAPDNKVSSVHVMI